MDFVNDFNRVINDSSVFEADEFAGSRELETEFTADAYDNYIGMEIELPRGPDDEVVRAMVKRRAMDLDGKPIGTHHKNPILDSRMNELEYSDGTLEHVGANVIAENVLSQGHRQ